MHELQKHLARSYELHPQFQFDQRELLLRRDLLTAFEDAYEALRADESRPGLRLFVKYKRKCIRALSDIFLDLQLQVTDPYESRFLQELYAECRRLLLEEADHFRTICKDGVVTLTASKAQSDAQRLKCDRHYFGTLPQDTVQKILEIGATNLLEFRQRAARGSMTRESLSVNSGPSICEIVRILNMAYEELGVLDSISAYASQRMSVTGLALELSVPSARWWANSFTQLSRPPLTLYAHIDESIKYPKSIVYLSDVDETTGPTSCYLNAYEELALSPLQEIVGRVVANVGNSPASPLYTYYGKRYHQSMSSERFRKHFMMLPAAIRFNSHLGWDIYPQSEAEASLVRREEIMVGPAGTFIVFDGARLLHRGGMVQNGERIALQVVFSKINATRQLLQKIKSSLI